MKKVVIGSYDRYFHWCKRNQLDLKDVTLIHSPTDLRGWNYEELEITVLTLTVSDEFVSLLHTAHCAGAVIRWE
jgi:hypothetical protein